MLTDQMASKDHHVILVDQADGFDWMTDTVKDMVHPNQTEEKKIAERWMQALEPILKKSNRVVPQ